MHKFFFLLILAGPGISSKAQQKTAFDSLVDKVYFNVFDYRPDSSIRPFVEKYFPVYADQRNKHIKCRLDKQEVRGETEHIFIFSKHPFLEFPFTDGRFEFKCFEGKDLRPVIDKKVLCFNFFSRQDAEHALRHFNELFRKVSIGQDSVVENGMTINRFSKTSKLDSLDHVEIVLTKDEIDDGWYKLYFLLGYLQRPLP